MTLREYIAGINNFAKQNPQALDYIVVHASDDEGNHFYPVLFGPTQGVYENGDFVDQMNQEDIKNKTVNAVCIN